MAQLVSFFEYLDLRTGTELRTEIHTEIRTEFNTELRTELRTGKYTS